MNGARVNAQEFLTTNHSQDTHRTVIVGLGLRIVAWKPSAEHLHGKRGKHIVAAVA